MFEARAGGGRPWKVVKIATDLTKRKAVNAALAHDFETGVKQLVNAVASSAENMQSTAQDLRSVGRADEPAILGQHVDGIQAVTQATALDGSVGEFLGKVLAMKPDKGCRA